MTRCKACNKLLDWEETAFCEGYCFDCFKAGEDDFYLKDTIGSSDKQRNLVLFNYGRLLKNNE